MRRITWVAASSTALVTAMSGAVTAWAAPAPPELRIPDQYVGSGRPAIADFNGDGFNDVVMPGTVIRVLPGDGSGGLGPAISTALPADVSWVADYSVDDVDVDGVPDLVLDTSVSTRTILTMTGKGDGTFRPRAAFTAIRGSGELATADVDGDGDPDLAYSHNEFGPSAAGIEVLTNDGRGKFGSPTSYQLPASLGLNDLTAQDVNDDGAVDLVYAIGHGSGCPAVRLNQGDGTFGPEICGGEMPDPVGSLFSLGDFNRDGAIDIATIGGSGVVIARGDNTGQFEFFREFDVGRNVTNLETGDLDGDGRLDLLAGTGASTALLTGNGDATFDTAVRWVTGGYYFAVGQLGGSPLPELVATGLETDEISVSMNLGQGRFYAPRLSDASESGRSLALGDLDGDGLDDVALLADDSAVEAHLTGPDATFGPALLSPIVPSETTLLELADVDEDGVLDAVGVVDVAPRLFVALGRGDGSFRAPTRFSNGAARTPTSVVVADVNNDAHLDLVTPAASQISVRLGDGDGGFGAPILSGRSLGFGQTTLVGGLDGDADLDLVGSIAVGPRKTGLTRVYVNSGNGDGTFSYRYERTVDTRHTGADLGDLNGDGLAEFAVTGDTPRVRASSSAEGAREGLFVWANRGGVLAMAPTQVSEERADGVTFMDLNDDGSLDAVTRGDKNIDLGFLGNNGDGTLAAETRLTPVIGGPQDSLEYKQGDVTGDGKVDIVNLYDTILSGRATFAAYINTTP